MVIPFTWKNTVITQTSAGGGQLMNFMNYEVTGWGEKVQMGIKNIRKNVFVFVIQIIDFNYPMP